MSFERPWKPPANFRLMAVVWFCLASLALTDKEPPEDGSLLNLVLSSLALHGPILLAVGIFLKGSGITWNRAFGFSTPPVGRALLLGLIATIVFLPVGLVLQDLSIKLLTWWHFSTPTQTAVEQFTKSPAVINRAYLAFFAIVIAPFAEEVFFRGVVYAFLKKIGHPAIGMWLSAIVFAAIHFNPPIFLPLLVMGLLLAWLYKKTNNLLAPITAHSVFNTINVILILYGDNLNRFYEQRFHH